MAYKTIDGITSSVIPYYFKDITCYVLLGKRKDKSKAFPGYWCLVGGFLEPCIETLEQCASRELREETGLQVEPSLMSLVTVQSDPRRDPRGHIIDSVWSCLLDREVPAVASDDLADVQWIMIEDALQLNLAFDHEQSLYLFGIQEGFF